MKKFAFLILSIFATLSLSAQVTTSNISGKVTDVKGEALVGATVVAIHTPSGTQYGAVVDIDGNYRLLNVRAGGPYTVQFQMLGYQTVEQQGLQAALADNLVLDATLKEESIGMDAVVVAVDGANSSMNSQRSGSMTSISSKRMAVTPSVSRSMNDIMKLTPQANSTSNGLAIGGGNYRQSYVTVDGAAFNNAFGIGGNLPAGGTPISLDALEQISISITPFDVRQSGFTGGAINAVTKSGTNEFKATVYDYYQDEFLKGAHYGVTDETGMYKRLNKSKQINNTTGVSVGGPIVKDKLFFFANFEYDMDETPGSTRQARPDENTAWGSGTTYNRPTVAQMEDIKKFLMEQFGYDPGRYQGYSLSTPDWKLVARLDWNINKNHSANVRFSTTRNKYSSNPSSSVNPLNPNPYNRNNYGRTSQYAMYFESSRYFQEQNFTSFAAELNSRFLDGRLTNTLRGTYSKQYEPRSFVGDNFPTVDILQNITNEDGTETKALLTSFGPDPFTYGNLRDVSTTVITDEIAYTAGKHNIIAGLQFEHNNTKNGFMQGGLGYYVYNSWEDFVAAAKGGDVAPLAFAITHSNRDDLKQVFPSFQYIQYSAYVQDEISFSNRFKLSAGIRFELPTYPSIEGNNNKKFEAMYKDYGGYRTADMPKARLNVAPRVGFNWDIAGDRKYVLRGGTGIFTGRIPFVWIVSVAGNSNCLQAQYIATHDKIAEGMDTPGFHQNVNDILTDLYGGTFKATDDLAAPSGATILDKNLKMQGAWKSTLALDMKLPGDIKVSLEGIYNMDMNTVMCKYLGMQEKEGGVTLPGEPAARKSWSTPKGLNNAYYITNAGKNGHYYSFTVKAEKEFRNGLSLMAAYTHSGSKNVIDGIGDQVSSAYNTNTFNVHGSNNAELGYSSYVAPHRVIASVGYNKALNKNVIATLGLFYEGFNYGYVGGYSYNRYSYTLSSCVTGDKGASNLMYIPTDKELASMPFAKEDNKKAFASFLASDKYLSKHRGEYATRGGAVMPWYNSFNFKFATDIILNTTGRQNKLTVGVDVNNVGNLICGRWGNVQELSTSSILKWDGSNYTFTQPTWNKYAGFASTWSAMLSFRYTFN